MNDETNTLSPELGDEDLDRVAGGFGGPNNPCPDYGSTKRATLKDKDFVCPDCGSTKRAEMKDNDYVCPDCGHVYFTGPSVHGFF